MYCYLIRKYAARILAAGVTVASVLSCESERTPSTFYPIDSLVSGQVEHLAGTRARLFKEAVLAGETDTVTYVPSDSSWAKELDIFRKLDEINKPFNRTNYDVQDGLFDAGSNLKVKSFESKKELDRKDVPIVYLKIYYQGALQKPRKIEARYEEDNVLYRSSRFLSMHFQQIGNKTVLTSYSVTGGQKMILGDSVSFIISGKVLID